MIISLVTKNKHKLDEISSVMKLLGVEVVQLSLEKEEGQEGTVEHIAASNAKKFANSEGKNVLVDDTGIFFDAYPGFPGQNAKWAFATLGYEGLLKLLEGKTRGAEFRCAAAFCKPGGEPIVEVGVFRGMISQTVFGHELDVMPYERIFIPEGEKQAMCFLLRSGKNLVSHRAIAFRKLAKKILATTS